MLIKDPYLESNKKDIDIRSQPLNIHPNISTTSQPVYSELPRNRAFSGGDAFELKGRVKAYEKQMRNMEEAYVRQEQAARKMLNFQQVNRQYHEAMRMRNFELNTKLKDTVNQIHLVHNRSQEDYLRYAHDKDIMVKKYQEQADQILRLRANCNCLIEQKTRLEEQLNNVSFLIEKERHQNELDIKECAFRMESMERTYKGLVSAKDEQIGQLVNRLRLYEDENRKLNDINKTLQLTKDRNERIDNLSQIHHPESNIKSLIKDRDKQNEDMNAQRSHYKENQELKQQKTINQQMRKQLDKMKKQLADLHNKNSQLENQTDRVRSLSDGLLYETSKWEGVMASITTLREGINKEIFELFFKSVTDGEKRKQNSLVIFIENWKCLDMERLQPYLKSYFEARNNLKEIASSKQAKDSPHLKKIQEVIPMRVGARPGRSNINQWILSTIQFTKNQKQAGKKGLNNFLLFLFRLLTIQYRVKYPMQGKSYHLDEDVKNELMHEIIKGLQLILKYK